MPYHLPVKDLKAIRKTSRLFKQVINQNPQVRREAGWFIDLRKPNLKARNGTAQEVLSCLEDLIPGGIIWLNEMRLEDEKVEEFNFESSFYTMPRCLICFDTRKERMISDKKILKNWRKLMR